MDSKNCDANAPAGDDRGLFERDWEVFVIRHDRENGGFRWFIECCERLAATTVNAMLGRTLSPSSCSEGDT